MSKPNSPANSSGKLVSHGKANVRRFLIITACFAIIAAVLLWKDGGGRTAASVLARPDAITAYGGTDINLITGTETHPRITQNESSVWSHGNTVVIAYDDSSGGGNLSSPSNCGVSVSTDGGATFTRLSYKFNEGGQCRTYPSVIYSARAAKWFISFLTNRCGASGIGQWESADGINWSNSGCVATSTNIDLFSVWIDNNPASPYYGRQYALFHDFNTNGGAPRSTFSTDDGVNWSAPFTLHSSFRRPVKITGSPGADGTVFAQTMDEGGGGLNGPRQNFIYRSTDGGATWGTAIQQNANTFFGPGRSASGYFPGMYTTPQGYWRTLGWGQPGVGPDGVVHYVYATRPDITLTDPGDVYYIRSLDNGSTWSVPLKMNTDTTTRGQWQPSLSVNAAGRVFVSWYDERSDMGESLQYYGRASQDNGATWEQDMPISDVNFPRPLQPDLAIFANDVGVFNHAMFSNGGYGNTALHAWVDGRVAVNGIQQQDVFFDKIRFARRAEFDFDGDNRADISVFRPSSGTWYLQQSTAGFSAIGFGQNGDRIAPADYDGDGRTDVAVFRSGTWYLLRSQAGFLALSFGLATDVPLPADYSGDGRAEVAVFRPSSGGWFIYNLATNQVSGVAFGSNGDVPVAADYDGDARADIAVFRPLTGVWYLQRSMTGFTGIQFGAGGDKPVPADYDGDGRADVAVFRPSDGGWYLLRSQAGFTGINFGLATDRPVPADYDGDGKADVAVFRPSNSFWYLNQSSGGLASVQFGISTDQAVPASYVP